MEANSILQTLSEQVRKLYYVFYNNCSQKPGFQVINPQQFSKQASPTCFCLPAFSKDNSQIFFDLLFFPPKMKFKTKALWLRSNPLSFYQCMLFFPCSFLL